MVTGAVPDATPAVPLEAETDPEHGGRWTSLRGGGREWLWHREEPRRTQVAPGDPFADAGGLEECVPTVRGLPDHGEAWTRPWTRDDKPWNDDAAPSPDAPANAAPTYSVPTYSMHCDDFTLSRRMHQNSDGAVVADYRLLAEPGYRFLWAAHALLDLSPRARLLAPDGTIARLFPEAAAYLEPDGAWPVAARWIDGVWPDPAGFRLDTLGPDDGSAVGAVLFVPGAKSAGISVLDDADELRMTVEAEDQPVSVALWRNLCGFPPENPYRSIGIEPMLGRVFDLDDAAGSGEDCATAPPGGEVRWRLTVTARRRPESARAMERN